MQTTINIFWFRRDLRLDDNAALSRALASGNPVLPIFIFDPSILSQLAERHDRRVDYIQQALSHLHTTLQWQGSGLRTFYNSPEDAFNILADRYAIQGIFWNRDYEPLAKERDSRIVKLLKSRNIPSYITKDQVIFDRNDILKADGTPYTVYTPYARKWKDALHELHYQPFESKWQNFLREQYKPIHTLDEIGFKKTNIIFSGAVLDASLIRSYGEFRNYPSKQNTSRLGIALRFGTISIRRCIEFALKHSESWLAELIWREFFMQVLDHFPHVVKRAFKPQYDRIHWQNDEESFRRWCRGRTGFPIVDAGMRQLDATGYMHNRVRMITASFLCKHLLIDWRWGEAHFAQKLDDFDLAANNGNWQWAAGSGCDAAPYFRIFNPQLQLAKFDSDFTYIKTWVPEWGTPAYPAPIVDHHAAREQTLRAYRLALTT